MNRIVMGSSVSAVVLIALFWFWPQTQSARLSRELDAARSEAARLGQQIEELRTHLAEERARTEAASADLRREHEMNMRLQMIVSEGRK